MNPNDTGFDAPPHGPGRPPGSNMDYLDTGPLLEVDRYLAANPSAKRTTVYRLFAGRICNAEHIEPLSAAKRLSRSYPRWLNTKAEFLSRD
jgi:hypothetical protein